MRVLLSAIWLRVRGHPRALALWRWPRAMSALWLRASLRVGQGRVMP
jgi:hypothetical protein